MPFFRTFSFRTGPVRVALLAVALVPALSACSPIPGEVRSGSGAAVRQPVRQPSASPWRPAPVHMMPGLEGVIGATQPELLRQFGPARLDVWEGDARKLQFSGTPCVLDIYLYPSGDGREPQATYVDARRPSDGRDVDRAACVAALKRR